jgi:hypothetical protein
MNNESKDNDFVVEMHGSICPEPLQVDVEKNFEMTGSGSLILTLSSDDGTEMKVWVEEIKVKGRVIKQSS